MKPDIYVCMRVCMYLRRYIGMYIYVCVCVRACVRACIVLFCFIQCMFLGRLSFTGSLFLVIFRHGGLHVGDMILAVNDRVSADKYH